MPLALPARSSWAATRSSEAVPVVLIALAVLGSLIARVSQGSGAIVLLLLLPALAAIGLRHRHPLEALVLAVAVDAALPDNRAAIWPVLLVLYTTASQRSWPTRTLAALAAGTVLVSVVAWLAWGHTGVAGDNGLLGYGIGTSAEAAASVALGLYVGARRRVMDGLRERAERLDRERELLADRAVAEERVRIAQELHDVVAHNVSLMVVRAQGLGATVDAEPVKSTTDAIADLGREAMTEMHRTLRLLRTNGAGPELAPQPGLAMLDRLLQQTRAAGLEIELSVEGRPRPLSQGIDLSAFRIVQEALTNVLKHAGRARTHITLSFQPHELLVSVVDTGELGREPDAPREDPADGHGLIGMRERAALFGGTLTATAGVERGFAVTATLPYGEQGA